MMRARPAPRARRTANSRRRPVARSAEVRHVGACDEQDEAHAPRADGHDARALGVEGCLRD